MSITTLTAAENKKSVNVNRGDEVVIRLPESPTTGYRWAVEQVDETILKLLSKDSAPGGAVGGSGEAAFTFKAERPGSTAITLKLGRQWEGEQSATERFEATINVS
jgi:inhibitor of cysteine peptidase